MFLFAKPGNSIPGLPFRETLLQGGCSFLQGNWILKQKQSIPGQLGPSSSFQSSRSCHLSNCSKCKASWWHLILLLSSSSCTESSLITHPPFLDSPLWRFTNPLGSLLSALPVKFLLIYFWSSGSQCFILPRCAVIWGYHFHHLGFSLFGPPQILYCDMPGILKHLTLWSLPSSLSVLSLSSQSPGSSISRHFLVPKLLNY